tara:strand:+ start:1002 stop:1175 length:174 start_codon:yes stop_codon:yes gene_type:complete
VYDEAKFRIVTTSLEFRAVTDESLKAIKSLWLDVLHPVIIEVKENADYLVSTPAQTS